MTKQELSGLKRLRRNASLETASFSKCTERLPITVTDVDKFVKERTRLHRESWILPKLDALIKKYDYKLNGIGEEPKGYNPLTEDYKW